MGHRILRVLLFPFLLALNSFLHYGQAQGNVSHYGQAQDAKLSIHPDWHYYFIGMEKVTLSCNMQEGSGQEWEFKLTKDGREWVAYSDNSRFEISLDSFRAEGIYQCIGRRKTDSKTKESNYCTIFVEALIKAEVALEHRWPQIYTGEEVTLRCLIPEDEWDFEWKTNGSNKLSKGDSELKVKTSASNIKDEYMCRGSHKHSLQMVTEWSDPFYLSSTLPKPQPILTVSQRWLTPRASITLRCLLDQPSSEWKYNWFKVTRLYGYPSISFKKLLLQTQPTEQNSFIVHDQQLTEGYACSAVRGEPVFESLPSGAQFVWSGDPYSSVSLSVNPNSVQHYSYGKVSLSCEGFATRWKLWRCFIQENAFRVNDCQVSQESVDSIFSIGGNIGAKAVYLCESDNAFSNAVNITIDDKRSMILMSPALPVREGDNLTLICWSALPRPVVSFYKDHKVIFTVTESRYKETEMVIPAISKRDEGFYKCGTNYDRSIQSWVSVTAASKPEGQTSIVLVLVGLMIGVLLIVSLVLIYFWRKKKGQRRPRLSYASYVNPSPAGPPTVNYIETHTYQSLRPVHLESTYESIRGYQNTSKVLGNSVNQYDDSAGPDLMDGNGGTP